MRQSIGLFLVYASLLALFCAVPSSAGAYDIRKPEIKAAREYPAHQDFQNVLIAAHPCETQEKAAELFDTEDLIKKQILPILVVVENNNDFVVGILNEQIVLLGPDGAQYPAIPFADVLLHISLRRPLSSYSTRKDILLQQSVKKDVFLDFEHKAFGEKLIAPHGSDYGVVFFPLPEDGRLDGFRLYFPHIFNVTGKEPLMFFEFDLQPKRD